MHALKKMIDKGKIVVRVLADHSSKGKATLEGAKIDGFDLTSIQRVPLVNQLKASSEQRKRATSDFQSFFG